MTDLQSYLQEFSAKPFVRGVSDCCALAAGWIEIVSGRKVEHEGLWRPLSDSEAAQITKLPEGLPGIARKVLNTAGWKMREGDPQDGDIIIAHRSQCVFPVCLGIWSHGHLVSVGKHGIRYVSRVQLMEMEVWHGN